MHGTSDKESDEFEILFMVKSCSHGLLKQQQWIRFVNS